MDSNDEWVPLPNLYVGLPVGEGVAVGLGITTPFGQGIDWHPTDLYNPSAPASIYQAEIMSYNFV